MPEQTIKHNGKTWKVVQVLKNVNKEGCTLALLSNVHKPGENVLIGGIPVSNKSRV